MRLLKRVRLGKSFRQSPVRMIFCKVLTQQTHRHIKRARRSTYLKNIKKNIRFEVPSNIVKNADVDHKKGKDKSGGNIEGGSLSGHKMGGTAVPI